MSARSCDQLCPITADHMYTGKCRLSAFLSTQAVTLTAPVPPVSVYQCPSMPPASATSTPHFSAHQCHINDTYQCPSELPFSVTHQCQSVPPISASNQCHYQCCPISASRCRLSVCISAA
ncbi:unnamed protein product [Staurois parvus]|uniref:Uncharacterized protein n=1 Tax=Staurois parvus TaxID=386267 RepID=A0ABN9HDK4_9NEOB|nr:unnamed protein product [Staurois parvus]